jgi:LPS-assembly lipoprotein
VTGRLCSRGATRLPGSRAVTRLPGSRAVTRRDALALAGCGLAVGGLGGCGFHPLYRSTASGAAGSARRELDGIFVEVISDRPGQLLRQALQQRFQGPAEGGAGVYTLHVDYSIAGEGIGIQADNTVTRVRFIARARYILRTLAPPSAVVTSGSARSVDSENIIANQLFAADLETEAAQRRLADAVADQVTTQLAAFFRKRDVG